VAHTVDILLDEFEASHEKMPDPLKRAEPRLGAFVALCLAKIKKVPDLPDTTIAAGVRNKVIHDEKVPTEDEAFKIGEEVRRCILSCQSSLGTLHEDYAHGVKSMPRRTRILKAAKVSESDLAGVSHRIDFSRIGEDIRKRVASIRKARTAPGQSPES
jgi:hypothetical protein